MGFALIGAAALVIIVGVAAFSRRLGVAMPLVLVVVGLGVSYLPGVPAIVVPPWLILEALLPPLLYAAAVQVPVMDFRRNFGAISTLSVGLVAATMLGVGLVLYGILPGLDAAAALALGAVVAPTDAVAATAVAKRMGLPGRLVTLLEGESLVNDASALVLLKSAVGAMAATVSMLQVAGAFAFSVVVAVAIGLGVGYVTVFVRSKLHDPVLVTTVSFVVPFVAYIPVEALGASGVLSVVVAGIYSGHAGAKHFSAQSRISERLNWRTVQFVLENGVFLLIGLQLKAIVAHVPHDQIGIIGSVALGVLIVCLLLVIRSLFVGGLLLRMRLQGRRARRVAPQVANELERERRHPARNERSRRRRGRALERRSADLHDRQNDVVGVRGGAVLTWAGMRGVVTLAAAQSLPSDTPYRAQLILMAVTVTILTLLLQGGTLPWLMRLTGVRGTDLVADRRELAQLIEEIGSAGESVLQSPQDHLPDGEEVGDGVIERLRHDVGRRRESAWERVENIENEGPSGPHAQYRSLRAELLAAEREALLEARSRGSYSSRILAQAERMLDLEESRLQQDDDPG